MSTDLHSRLLAAVEERERRARAATPGPWRVEGMTVRGLTRLNHSDCLVVQHTRPQEAEHIAAENPAFVLRQCARDRRVLDRHEEFSGWCRWCYAGQSQETGADEFMPWPCIDITELAEAYGVDP